MKINYSGKKRQYSRNVMVMVMLDGRITYLSSDSYLLSDQGLLNVLHLYWISMGCVGGWRVLL